MEGEVSSVCPNGHQGFEEISPGIRVCLTDDTPPRVRTIWIRDATDGEFVAQAQPSHWVALDVAQRLWDTKRDVEQLRTGLGELAHLVATRGTRCLSAAEIIYAIHNILRGEKPGVPAADRATPKGMKVDAEFQT